MAVTQEEVVVVGTGARTPLGLNAPATAAAVRAGIAAMGNHPFMIDQFGDPMVVSRDAELPSETGGVDRFVQLALPAALEALRVLPAGNSASIKIRLHVALPEDRPGLPADLKAKFAERFQLALGENFQVEKVTSHALGNAAGIAALEEALSEIERGESEFCLVGGVESYLMPETLEWLDSVEQLHSPSTIWGFCPGEGAGFFLLTSGRIAKSLGLSSTIRVLSAAKGSEPNRIRTETICIGEGLSDAFQQTLSGLPTETDRVDHTICDMNGDRYRGDEYSFARLRSADYFSEFSDFDTPGDCWGDMGAASGPLFVVLASVAAEKRYSPGPITLVWGSSDGGLRAGALLKATTMEGRS